MRPIEIVQDNLVAGAGKARPEHRPHRAGTDHDNVHGASADFSEAAGVHQDTEEIRYLKARFDLRVERGFRRPHDREAFDRFTDSGDRHNDYAVLVADHNVARWREAVAEFPAYKRSEMALVARL